MEQPTSAVGSRHSLSSFKQTVPVPFEAVTSDGLQQTVAKERVYLTKIKS